MLKLLEVTDYDVMIKLITAIKDYNVDASKTLQSKNLDSRKENY